MGQTSGIPRTIIQRSGLGRTLFPSPAETWPFFQRIQVGVMHNALLSTPPLTFHLAQRQEGSSPAHTRTPPPPSLGSICTHRAPHERAHLFPLPEHHSSTRKNLLLNVHPELHNLSARARPLCRRRAGVTGRAAALRWAVYHSHLDPNTATRLLLGE
jgi:hypothetical protein